MTMTSFLRTLTLLGCVFALHLNAAKAAEVGEILKPVKLADANDQPADIPDLGSKVLAIFYNDADEADLNDPLADAIKARDFNDELYRGIGVANLEDSKAPNFIIRSIIRGKIEKYNSTILTDPALLLPKAWGLGDCNNDSVVLLIGKDRKLERIQRGAIRGNDIEAWLAHIDRLLAPPAPPEPGESAGSKAAADAAAGAAAGQDTAQADQAEAAGNPESR